MQDSQAFGVSALLHQADAVGMSVAVLLLAMSVASWSVILFKGFRVLSIRRTARDIMEGFWSAPNVGRAVEDIRDDGTNPFAVLVLSGVNAAAHHQRAAELLEREDAAGARRQRGPARHRPPSRRSPPTPAHRCCTGVPAAGHRAG